ncbi:MAG: aminotransferase class III-fold pyridoxal phosphate-dependent enzyme [Chitinivibrionales bacterium]|nr:aminotransferase class III-fold pyridoxal phosphate-dependent enzyme [Chitinivibrionales bacterium]
MTPSENTMRVEGRLAVPFFDKAPLSIERGEGVYVWTEDNKKYLDFTSGWGVTSIGHAHPALSEAICRQSKRIIQNPNSGATYSPVRAQLLQALQSILPGRLTRLFFANSGAEANDAAIKLARKATGRMNIISTEMSFHGRTISTASATGQATHRDKFNPLMPNYIFVPFNDIEAIARHIDDSVAAVILEPIQGEGGVNIPDEAYLPQVSSLCRKHGVYLIMDEVQTGFYRTGAAFASDQPGVHIDFLTMAKGIAGGFPFGAFAMTEEVSAKMEKGDHGGTFCGSPLGCAAAYAVIDVMKSSDIGKNVESVGSITLETLHRRRAEMPDLIAAVRGKGLLIALVMTSEKKTAELNTRCLEKGLILNVKQGTIVRLFPALTITQQEMDEGLAILHEVLLQINDA